MEFNLYDKTDNFTLNNILNSYKQLAYVQNQKKFKYMKLFLKNQGLGALPADLPTKKLSRSINQYNYQKNIIEQRVQDRLLSRNFKPKLEYDGDFDTMVEELNNNLYKKTWNRLHPELKINRILHYIKFLQNKYNFSSQHHDYLYQQLSNAIRKKLITKKTHITYDSDNGIILSIQCLKFSENDNSFSIIFD